MNCSLNQPECKEITININDINNDTNINKSLKSLNDSPKNMNNYKRVIIESPKNINESPKNINESPKNINESPKNINSSRIINESPKANFLKYNPIVSEKLLYNNFFSLSTTNDNNIEITYQMICDILRTTYNYEESITSTALDILGIYLKGQKILYIEAKTLCEKRLYTLMLPAIFISAISIILNILLNSSMIGSIILSILSVINSLILTLVTYLKLDAKAEAHKISSYKYQKLESLCEFKSGKILIFKNIDDITNILIEIESKVLEIKESNQFILPELIRHSYPIIYSTNVFTLVKKLQNEEIIIINNLKLIIKKIIEKKREKNIYENKITINHTDNFNKISILQEELDKLEKERDDAFNNVIIFREKYLNIDKIFNDEIDKQKNININFFDCCNWLKT